MNDPHLDILLQFYNILRTRHTVEILHNADFVLLPPQALYGIVADGRPLSDLFVPCILLYMVFAKFLTQWQVDHGRIPTSRMAMQ